MSGAGSAAARPGERGPSARSALVFALVVGLGLALVRLGIEWQVHRLAERKLAAAERRLAPRFRVAHRAVEVGLVPPRLTIRDLTIRAGSGATIEVRRVVVRGIDVQRTPPRHLDVELAGVSAALAGASGSELLDSLLTLGYTRIAGDGRLVYRSDGKGGTMALEALELRAPGIGDLRLRARLQGFDPAQLRSGDLTPLRLEELDLAYRDETLLGRVAAALGAKDPALRSELQAGLEEAIGMVGGDAASASRNVAALRGLLASPGPIRVDLRLRAPVAASVLAEEHVLSRVLRRFTLELSPVPTSSPVPAHAAPRTDPRFFDRIRKFEGASTTTVKTGEGKVLGHIGEERRFPVDLVRLPAHVTQAFLAAEDAAFHEHEGVDPTGVVRALLRNARAAGAVQGGSTITQQLIKRLVVGAEKSLGRKLEEALLALRLERASSKKEILRVYLDQIYFGSGAYGVEAAARTYFAKPAARLAVAEAALLAGLPRAPSANNPYQSPEGAVRRQRYVLARMRELGWLGAAEHDRAVAQKLVYRPSEEGVWTAGAWYMEEVRRWLARSFDGRSGLEVRAAIDLTHQAAAEEAVAIGLEEAAERIGDQGQGLEAALVSIDPATGRVLALVGGRSFEESQFNRATQARRQAGSAFKPFVFSAALDAGYTAASVLDDAPRTFLDPTTKEPWEPANFGGKYHGPVLLRTALVRSLNLATVRLAEAIGVRAVRDRARALGIEGDIPPYLSISLGSADVTLLSMTRAYTAFARGGSWIEPQFVLAVSDASGREVYAAEPKVVQAVSPANAYIVTTLLKDVIRSGTATVCRALGRPAAGKTGTSNEARDGWFIGYTPYLVTGVWVGYDDASPMGDEGVGGRVAAPIWLRYRQAIEDEYEVEDFRRPRGVVFRTVSASEVGATGDGDAVFELPFAE